jgi:two-component system, response regulator PdtaR
VSQKVLRVVIAEDEALIRLDLKEMLEEEGYSVVAEVGDGESAVERVTALRPDLAILDIKMPVLDGISAAERIASERLAPVVILTAFSQRELVERARDAGALAYLVKPFTKADLIPAVEMAVSRFAEIRSLDSEIGTLRERLEVRKLLDRAKGLLQSQYGLTEPQAFRWIQKTSMDRRLTMRRVAEAVIEGSLQVPAEPTTSPAEPGTSIPRTSTPEPGNPDLSGARGPLVPCRPSPADTFSTWTPGLAVTTLATGRHVGQKPAAAAGSL